MKAARRFARLWRGPADDRREVDRVSTASPGTTGEPVGPLPRRQAGRISLSKHKGR